MFCEPLKYLFNLSIEKAIFPDDLKIAKVTPIYKAGDKSDLSNYRPASVLSCFSKIVERIMYNHLYQFLTENKILFPKQFGFQTGHSTEYVIVQLVDQILESFEYNKYTLGVFTLLCLIVEGGIEQNAPGEKLSRFLKMRGGGRGGVFRSFYYNN